MAFRAGAAAENGLVVEAKIAGGRRRNLIAVLAPGTVLDLATVSAKGPDGESLGTLAYGAPLSFGIVALRAKKRCRKACTRSRSRDGTAFSKSVGIDVA